ncbi:histidine kinase [Paenibacillus sp. 1P07SE]|uniref:sensor histidine kinase n=1 Tax=Paenibacillus sp. 1P07SE TaxID=3132209 RepID=UPI0039A47E0E
MKALRQWADQLRHLRIVPKLIIGYVLLVFIPFTLFGFYFYHQMYENVKSQYLIDQEKFMDQSLANLEIEMLKIESVHSLFQNNDTLIRYLGGKYEADWEMIYTYQNDIRPTFSFALQSVPAIEHMSVYMHSGDVLSLEPDLASFSGYAGPLPAAAIQALRPNQGRWVADAAEGRLPRVHYIKNLYNDTYTEALGFLAVEVNQRLFGQLGGSSPQEEVAYWAVVGSSGERLYEQQVPGYLAGELTAMASQAPERGIRSFFVAGDAYLVHAIRVAALDLVIVRMSQVASLLDIRADQWRLIGAGVLLLTILSLCYFAVGSSMTNRIIRFSRHLKRVDDPKIAGYAGTSGSDEIGFLIQSYNAMIRRMDELTHDYHRSEMLKKEAEIKMLHAQIKPHFLYNTLETMRMMALMRGEKELAEVASSLGNLLRYSLVRNRDEALLTDELEHVRDYIGIHQVRMGERLQFHLRVEADISGVRTPRSILQPIVENSILHGLGKKRGQGVIEITVSEQEEHYLIEIRDNGPGLTAERRELIRRMLDGRSGKEEEARLGIGLRNVHERLKSYNGQETGITLEDGEGGAVFRIRLIKKGGEGHAEAADRR